MPFTHLSVETKNPILNVCSSSMSGSRSRLPLIGVECVLSEENYSHDVQNSFDLWDALKNRLTEKMKHMDLASKEKCRLIIKDVDTVFNSGGGELGEKDYAVLSLNFKKLRQQFSKDRNEGFSRELTSLSRHLEVETKAKWAELCRMKALSHIEEECHEYNRPGTYQERGGELSLGLGFGSEAAGIGLKAEGGIKGGFACSMQSNDDSSVTTAKQFSFGVFGRGVAGVFASKAEGVAQVTHSHEYNSIKHYAHRKVDKSLSGSRQQSSGKNRGLLARLVKKNELARYPRIIQTAVNQQSSITSLRDNGLAPNFVFKHDIMPTDPNRQRTSTAHTIPKGLRCTPELQHKIDQLIPDARTTPPRVHTVVELSHQNESIIGKKSTAPPFDASARTLRLAGTLGVNAAGFSVGVGGNIEETTLDIEVPVTLKNVIESQAKDLERARLKLVLKSGEQAAYERFPLVRPIFKSWFFYKKPVSEVDLNKSTDVLDHQFKNFCLKVQQYDYEIDIASSSDRKSIKNKCEVMWDREFKTSRENVLADLCKLHALLLYQVTKCDSHEAVLARLKGLGDQLYSPPISFDKKVFAQKTSFTDVIKVKKYSRTVELNLAAGIPALGAGGKVIYTEARLIHHKLYRAGDYRDLTLTLTAGMVLDAGGLNKIAVALAKQINLPGVSADTLNAEMSKMSLQLELEGSLKVMFRFFQPNYQQAEAFPHAAKGYQLQLTRVTTERIAKLSGAVPIVTPAAGLTVNVGGKLNSKATHVHLERWGENSLSAPMMHYMNLKGINESSRWEKLSNDCLYENSSGEDSFLKLAQNLVTKQSAVHLEAEYFLDCQKVGLDKEDSFAKDFFVTMLNFVVFNNQTNRKLAQESFEKLIERQYPLWEEEKLRYIGRTRGMDIQK
ncbi:hypothetical protein WAE56_20820 [Iodobacter sp. LRB]|uniref:hypothetical protein n=1 Tax=unclassified Iodobacter TaxID=235634 RepID=UPI000C114941|nr:hypothetical protein [Iodobacter sp. BJB302]PHU99531.1 hypothetical protein CSQ88_22025 [Iodobacter sp. BJB302]